MHVVELSNHPGDMLHDATPAAAGRREHALGPATRTRSSSTRPGSRRSGQPGPGPSASTAGGPGCGSPSAAGRSACIGPGRRRPAVPTDAEEKIKAGIAGEQQVAAELGQALDDDWTLLRGYRNRRGEIDHLLLGPRGLFAIEVKNINATVTHRRRPLAGRQVRQLREPGRAAADRRPQGPVAEPQLNSRPTELERFLHQRGQPVTVQRVVSSTHRRSRLGERQRGTDRPRREPPTTLRAVAC